MAFHVLSRRNGLKYSFQPPSHTHGKTFVCFNPLSGDKAMWESGIGPYLRDAGHGLLCWNLRGQEGSLFTRGTITPQMIVGDAISLIEKIGPPGPVFTGLSIGGLYAAQASKAVKCQALVLINTLRETTQRIRWVNDALVRLAETGGLDLLRDAYLPLLMNEDWQAENRQQFLQDKPYQPCPDGDGALQLLKAGRDTSWDFNWGSLAMPVLNITGLQDRVFRDPPVIDRLLARFKNVHALEYETAGHMIPAEQPARLAEDLAGFARQLQS